MFCSYYVDHHEDKIHNEISESDKKKRSEMLGLEFSFLHKSKQTDSEVN
jgi:hypothetical protein